MSKSLRIMRRRRSVPVFFAADDKYVKFMLVTMQSMIDNMNPSRYYMLHILHTDISLENQRMVKKLE